MTEIPKGKRELYHFKKREDEWAKLVLAGQIVAKEVEKN